MDRLAPFREQGEQFFGEHYWNVSDDWRSIGHDWLEAAGLLALRLESDNNNTCLALAFELSESRRVLLFPGDAQVERRAKTGLPGGRVGRWRGPGFE